MRETCQVADNSFRAWSTPFGLVVCGWLLAAATGLWCLLAESAVDQVFTAVLALVLAAAAGYASLVRPRLRADGTGISIGRLGGARHHPWSDVEVQVRTRQRFGRASHTLELDAADGLTVLGRIDLGEDPRDVAEQLDELRGDQPPRQ